ncbi:copper amine oxidase N-terminal domain-containing protein [Paenibacillus rigui]|nr:copper amine oxidase N-terminal domain-containing protein [Paenibacillus rigui]
MLRMKKWILASLCVGSLGLAAYYPAHASDSSQSTKIVQFQFIDNRSDKIAIAYADEPDGKKDGHFKLSLSFPEETEITSLVLKSGDHEHGQRGTWKTNSVGTGWLLAVYQDNKSLNKTYSDTVGKFKGNVTFDLYADDNNSIEPGTSFSVEINTPQASIVSESVPFGESASTAPAPSPTPNPSPSPTPSTTPDPTPTPSPAPAPSPGTDPSSSPGSDKPLMVKGGTGTVSVENGTPGSTMSLILKQPSRSITMGHALFSTEGKGTFDSVPPGSDYYVFDAAGKPYGPITVWEDPNSSLFNASKTTASMTLDLSLNRYSLKLNGEVQSSVKKVTLWAGNFSLNVPIDDNKFSLSTMGVTDKMTPRIELTAETADGTTGTIYIEAQRDFVNDLTVGASKSVDENGTWLIKGAYSAGKSQKEILNAYWVNDAGELTYLQDRRLVGKAAPRTEEEADLKYDMTDFEYKITTQKDRNDISFYVVNGQGEFEIVRPMEGLEALPSGEPQSDIRLQIDSTRALVGGKELKLEAAPFYLNGRTLVPLRFIGEATGAKVSWDSSDHTITLTRENTHITLQIGQKEAYVNERLIQLDAPPIVRDGVTVVPLRFISENLNMDVQFDEGNIRIQNKKRE